jgi:flavoprotein hydroxylase
VQGARGRGLLDDVVGAGGVLLLGARQLRTGLRPEHTALLADLGWRVVVLGAEPGDGDVTEVTDVTGAYARWLGELDAVAVLVRPDLYLYGAATDAEDLTALLDHLRRALQGG